MTARPQVSLLDLSKQFRFEIDDSIKDQICFGETLLVSCGHFEPEVGEDSTSEWSCSTRSEVEPDNIASVVKTQPEYEIKKIETREESEKKLESDDEENDFHTFFFPDCSKPLPPTNSKASLVIESDGLPKIKPKHDSDFCICKQEPKTLECDCFMKIPCKCGAVETRECTCAKLEGVCICRKGDPQLKCTCRPSTICVCDPNNNVSPECVCDTLIPCICDRSIDPRPICECKQKPKLGNSVYDESYASFEGAEAEHDMKYEPVPVPCDCQKPVIKSRCVCIKGAKCTCSTVCICDIRKPCVCEPTDDEQIICEDQDNKSICSCPVPQICTCDSDRDEICKCFPEPKITECTCENPDYCKCYAVCKCTSPCICDVQATAQKGKECTCIQKGSIDCTCYPPEIIDLSPLKLKKTRAAKHDYRWCRDIDPRHTYFDYAYGRHNKISHKDSAGFPEKVNILGLHETKAEMESSDTKVDIDAPEYKKTFRKPSIDCCSTLGGMSINVECLGESRDKFLIQVTSNFSKEGAKAGSKLISIIDCNLHTMEESKTEHLINKDTAKERKSYMAICDTGYFNKITKICDARQVVKRVYHTFEQAHKFLLEGANVVLLRYFAITRYKGKVKTDTVLINGLVCESVYVCHGISQAIVNGNTMFVCKVERHIIKASGAIHQTMTVLTLRGYIVCHEWADNNYILHINPLLTTVPQKDLIEEHAPLTKCWREDLQLLSDYLDFKSMRSSEGARYTSESSTLTNSIRDYLQALLMLRPRDAIHFTKHYFGATLSTFDLPYNDYFDRNSKRVRYFFFED